MANEGYSLGISLPSKNGGSNPGGDGDWPPGARGGRSKVYQRNI